MHVYDTDVDHQMIRNTPWLPSRPAEQVNDHIWLSRSNSYPHLITTPDGDVVINTGANVQGPRHRERFEQAIGRPLNTRAIVITQSHHDHFGGWGAFNAPGVETIVSASYDKVWAERQRLAAYFGGRRTAGMYDRRLQPGEPITEAGPNASLPVPTRYVKEPYRFEVGGRKFEVRQAPAGESLDGLLVWMPDEATVFCGNLMGAIYGALPHLSTIRGDRQRSARFFIEDVEALLALEPELLLTGHDHPVRGRQKIRDDLTKITEAVRYIYDWTLDGMAAGRSLEELMGEIRLPAALQPNPGRGPVSWYVRAVWEEYAGWYRADTITGLYPNPPRTVWPDLIEMAGGPQALLERARTRLATGKAVEALHFTDMILAQDPAQPEALDVEIAALQALRKADADEHYDVSRLLEMEIARAKAARGS